MMKKLIQQKCAKLEQERASLNAKKAASVSKPLFLKQTSEDMEEDQLSIARKKLSIISSKLSLNSAVDALENDTSKSTDLPHEYTRMLVSPEPHYKQTVRDDKSPTDYSDQIIRSAFFHESDVICASNDVVNVSKHSDTNTVIITTITISDSDDDFDCKPNLTKESEKAVQSVCSSLYVLKGKENDRNLENSNVEQSAPFLEPEKSNRDPPLTDEHEKNKETLEQTTPNINITILQELLHDMRENKDIPSFHHPLHQPRVSKVNNYEQLIKNRLPSVNKKDNLIENTSSDIRSQESVLKTSKTLTESNSNMGLNDQGNCARVPVADSCTNGESSENNNLRSMANFEPNIHDSKNTKLAVNYKISERDSWDYSNTQLKYNKQKMGYNSHDKSQHPQHNADDRNINRNIINSDYSYKNGQAFHDRITPGQWDYATKPFLAVIAPLNPYGRKDRNIIATEPCARSCYPLRPCNNNFDKTDLACTPNNTITGDITIQSDQQITPIPEFSPGDPVRPNHSFSQYPPAIANSAKFHEARAPRMTLDRTVASFRSHEMADRYNARSNNLHKSYNEFRQVSFPTTRRERSADRNGRSRYRRFNGGREHAGIGYNYHHSAEDRVQRSRSRPPDDRSYLKRWHEGTFEDRKRRAASMDRNLIYINTKDSIMNHRIERTLSSPRVPKNKNVQKVIEVFSESLTDSDKETREKNEKISLHSPPTEKKKAYESKSQENLNKDIAKHGRTDLRCNGIKDIEIKTTAKNITLQASKRIQPPAPAVLSEKRLTDIKSESVAYSKSKHCKKPEKIKPNKEKDSKSNENEKVFPNKNSNKKTKEEHAKISLSSQPRKNLYKKSYEPKCNQNSIKDIEKYKHNIFISPDKTKRVNTLETTRKKTTFKILKQLPDLVTKKPLTDYKIKRHNKLKTVKYTEASKNKNKSCIYKKSKTTVSTKKVTKTKSITKKKKCWPELNRDELTKQKIISKVRKAKNRIIYSDSDSDAVQRNNNNEAEPSKGKNVTATEKQLNRPDSDDERPVEKINKFKVRRIVYSDSDSEILQETVKFSKNTSPDHKITEKLNSKIKTPNKNFNTQGSDFEAAVITNYKAAAVMGSEAHKEENIGSEIITCAITGNKTDNDPFLGNNHNSMLDVMGNVYKNTSTISGAQLNSKSLTKSKDFEEEVSNSTDPRSTAAAAIESQAHNEEKTNSEIISYAGNTDDENILVNNHDAMPIVMGNKYKRTSVTSGEQTNVKSITNFEHTIKLSPYTATSIIKNKEGNLSSDKSSITESRNSPEDEDICISKHIEQNELNNGALSLSNKAEVLENAIPHSIKEDVQEQSFKERLSVAWKLLKDVPKSILLCFMYDLCRQREKEEIVDIIKCLNNIAFDEKEDNVPPGLKVKVKRKRRRPPKHTPTSTKIDEVANLESKKTLIVKDNKPGAILDGVVHFSTTETDKKQQDLILESENNDKVTVGLSYESDNVNVDIQKKNIEVNSKELDVSDSDKDCDSHFKIYSGDNGAKEYICCVNGNNHFKSKLKVQMKKHVAAEHPEIWDGYCSFCKENVSIDRLFTFNNCFEHMFTYHLDEFPTLESIEQHISEDLSSAELGITCQFDNNKTTEETGAFRANEAPVNGLTLNIYDQVNINKENLSNPVTAIIGTKDTVKTEIEGVDAMDKEDIILPSKTSCSETSVLKTFVIESIYKYEEHQTNIIETKHSSVLRTMLSEEKLIQIYKCAARFCAYTTNSIDLAKEHVTAHQEARVRNVNALKCSYCDFNYQNNVDDLVKHVFETHGRCRYTCSQCFYRAAASQLVLAHMNRVHPKHLKKILEAPCPDYQNEEESLPQHIKIQRYYCHNKSLTPECKRSYFSQGSFIRHLQNHDAPYLCYICNQTSDEPDKLLQHMSGHGLKKYHCTWCSEGGYTEEEFMSHFSARHPTRQPQAYLRKVDGMQEDKSRILVLPLVELNKSTVTTHLVASNAAEKDPVVEANKAHNLEELIESVDEEVQVVGVESTETIRNKLSAATIAKPTNQPSSSVEANIITELAKDKAQNSTSEDNTIKQVLKRKLPKGAAPERIHKRIRSREQGSSTEIQVVNSDEKAQFETDTENSAALPIFFKAATQYPKYVQEKRYTCGAKDCSLAFEVEERLLFHWKVYHPKENEFYCVHCKIVLNFVSWTEISNHLKLHGSTVYACSLCSRIHYQYLYLKRHIDEVHEGAGEIETVRDEHDHMKENHTLKGDLNSRGNNAELLPVNAVHVSRATVNTKKSYRVEEISPICIRLTATAEPREKTTVPT